MAENAQVRELLNPSTLQTVVTSALQAVQPGEHSRSNVGRPSKPFLGKPRHLLRGKMAPLTQRRCVSIVKIPGMK